MARNQGSNSSVRKSKYLLVDYIMSGTKVVATRCRWCYKFLKKNHNNWICPHCDSSLIEGISADEVRSMEDMIGIMEWMKMSL